MRTLIYSFGLLLFFTAVSGLIVPIQALAQPTPETKPLVKPYQPSPGAPSNTAPQDKKSWTEGARFSGAYLLKLCETSPQGKELIAGGHAACQAYISGVIDYHNVLQALRLSPAMPICVPEETSISQLHQHVLNYLRANKQHDSFVAAPAVTTALYQVYPCRKR